MTHSVKIKPVTKLQFQDFLKNTNYTADDVISAGMRYLDGKKPLQPKIIEMKVVEKKPKKKITKPFKPKKINGKLIYPFPKERIISG